MSNKEADGGGRPQEHEETADPVEFAEGECSWPDSTTARIIELWRDHPELYDLHHPLYSNRDNKQKVLSAIASDVKITGEITL
jgi:hypothetical protein